MVSWPPEKVSWVPEMVSSACPGHFRAGRLIGTPSGNQRGQARRIGRMDKGWISRALAGFVSRKLV
jgi:hypothetical protein